MPTAKPAKKRSDLKRIADPSKEVSAKPAKNARKRKLATWVSESKAARAATEKSQHKQAAVATAEAQKAVGAGAERADLELHNKKAEMLRSVLKQKMEEHRAGEHHTGYAQIHMLQYAQIHMLQCQQLSCCREGKECQQGKDTVRQQSSLRPTVCRCGNAMVFCKHPICLCVYCEDCEAATGDSDKPRFAFCAGCSDKCSGRQARGPYCKRHVKKYPAICGDGGVVACDNLVQECEACNRRICTDCLENEQCETCNHEWQDEYGIESDDSYGQDPLGYY